MNDELKIVASLIQEARERLDGLLYTAGYEYLEDAIDALDTAQLIVSGEPLEVVP